VVDIRDEAAVAAAVAKTVETFGGIDILVNNASAIHLTNTVSTPMKRYDLMHQINTRGTFVCSQACVPHLKKAANPHVLNLSPPLNMEARWFAPHVAYTMAKFGMSMCVLGMAEEFRRDGSRSTRCGRAPRSPPRRCKNLLGGDAAMKRLAQARDHGRRRVRDLQPAVRECTGNFFIDDEVLAAEGITDLEPYAMVPGAQLIPDFFI
jgi:citronellol/citronellal dehydrogenase